MKKLFAFALLAVAISVKAQDATTLYNEGVAFKDAKKPKEAIEKFKAAIALKPDYAAAFYDMGWCQNDTKDYSGAMISLRKARTTGWAAIPRVHFELGYAFEKSNLIDSAIQSYNKCLFYNSAYSGAYRQLGYIAYTKDDYVNALDYFAKYEAAAKTPITDYLYWYRKGFSYNAQKNYEAAKIALLRSLENKTDYINTYLELGFAATKLKQGDEAIEYFNKAIALDPKSHIGYNGIGEVYRDVKKDIDMAITWYKKTLTVKSDERKACFGLGYCYNSKGLYNDAITYLKKAIEQENTYTAAYVELGYSHYMTNNNSLAITNLKKALELNAKNENARYYLGLIYISQKDRAKAQQMADELKELNSKNAANLQEKVNKM